MHHINKISIIGNSAAGKSTLAKKLSEHLGIKAFTIDKLYWLPGWVLREQASFAQQHRQWLAADSWIIDGIGYWDELEARVKASDWVIFLDVAADICKQRAEARIQDESISPNQNISDGCHYGSVKELQMVLIDTFDRDMKPRLIELLDGLDAGKVQVLNSPNELRL